MRRHGPRWRSRSSEPWLEGDKDVLGSGNTDSQLKRLHRVSASSAKPGDLVYFGTLSNTHHVGIYIGNGLMINAYATGTYIQTNRISGQSDLVGYFAY